ncbi:zinc-binding domain-containing protein [Xylariaceae sp. FL1272]|nr:zinc-binding domain-containing protein [Xylariaceae sp. FL1272]
MAPNNRKPKPLSSMYPALDPDVSSLLAEDNLHFTFNPTGQDRDASRSYDTNIMGYFVCHNPQCDCRGWGSKRIAITIRMFEGRKYNATVWHQRCASCKSVGIPKPDYSYAERVAYRLKKWCGIDMEPPPYTQKHGKPHRSYLCEGCKAGHCTEADRLPLRYAGT